jgi:hypothetical protein
MNNKIKVEAKCFGLAFINFVPMVNMINNPHIKGNIIGIFSTISESNGLLDHS